MNRTERLYAVVELLRARAPEPLTARRIGEALSVSVRTVQRDLGALGEAGVPIWSTPGRGGGWTIDRAHTLPPLNLTPEEAVALALAVHDVPERPFGAAAERARAKLAAVLQQSSVAAADELAAKVRVLVPPRATDGAVLQIVEEAVRRSLVVRLRYVDAEGRTTTRAVEPAGFYGGSGRWHLVAWCRTRKDMRFFRLDRIASATLTDEAVAVDRSSWRPEQGEWLRVASADAK